MDFNQNDGPTPGQHYRPPSTDDMLFNQRTVPAVFVPAVAFAVMATFSPYEIGVRLWAGLALVVVPGLSGLILHSIGSSISIHRRAKRAFTVNFVLFVLYAVISMSIVHDRIQGSTDGGGALPAMALSAIGYGLIAGVVAGFVASLPSHHHVEKGY